MKVELFNQNHGLTPLQKLKFFEFLKMTFYSLERLVLSLKHYLEVFQGVFSIKTDMHGSSIFLPKSLVNPFAKMHIFCLFENDVFIV